MSDDSNITGRGAEILLPPQGNPFKRPAADAPADLNPDQVTERFGTLDGQGKAAVGLEEGHGGVEEPADLTPADIAAMFPASADERNAVPAGPTNSDVHMGARAAMIAPSTSPGRQTAESLNFAVSGAEPTGQIATRANINLSIFNPDQPIGAGAAQPPTRGSTAHMSARGPLTGGDSSVDITAFNPDQPIDAPAAGPAPDSGAPATAPSVDMAAPADSGAPSAAPAPVDSGAPSTAPSDGAPASPAVGFQPFDPFAPAGGRPPLAAPADVSTSALAAPSLAAPSSVAAPADQPPAVVSVPPATVGVSMAVPSPAAGGAVVVKAAVSTSDDDGPHLPVTEHNENLPSVPALQLPVQADAGIVTHLVTDERMDALWARIDAAEQLAINDDVSPPDQRTENLEHIKAARNLLFGGRENYEDALRYVAEVESDIHYATKVRQWSYSYGTVVLFYNILWLAILGAGLAATPYVIKGITQTNVLDEAGVLTIWLTVLAGGLGGVSKSLFALHQHVTKQDFDRQHLMWYYTSPILGVVLGIFVWAFVKLIVLGGGAMAGLQRSNSATVNDFVYYLLAWVVGFQQNLVLKLVEKVKDTLLPEEADKPAETVQSSIPPNSPPPAGG